MRNFSKRNHYNPCFWTAHWNAEYLERALAGRRDGLDARQQRVFVLNLKSDKIYSATVENVHFDKNLGVAEITAEAAKDVCRRHFPDEYEEFCLEIEKTPETVYLDFEDILSGLERTPAYTNLLSVIAKQRIDNRLQKGLLAGFIVYHHLRSHAIMAAMIERAANKGIHKFEYFWMLKHEMANCHRMFARTLSFAPGRWKFYRLRHDSFPLNDSPILVDSNGIMVALSPRLLLEIDAKERQPETTWEIANYISTDKLREFRRRTINNTFREIIFGSQAVLQEWQQTPEFKSRHKLVTDGDAFAEEMTKRGDEELVAIRACWWKRTDG
jgi:hypothetical protein